MSASGDEKMRSSGDSPPSGGASSETGNGNGPLLPTSAQDVEKNQPAKASLHPAFYVMTWISLSSSVILYNKWILDTLKFHYPVILTTYHLAFATLMTQLLARYTTLLDGRKTVKMTGRVYLRAIVPIGFCFSLSLICGNLTYLYLSVAFIQMLKATTPVAVLLSGWAMGLQKPSMKVLANVSAIVFGVILASVGEINFVLIGFLYQCGGIIFEALRLTMVQRLLSSAEYKMDPLVSLYYFAPVCAVMNGLVALFWELPKVSMEEVYAVGLSNFFLNGMVAFLLNVSVVFLIGKTSSLVLTLCGVLKDIMLVGASMLIWGTPVSALQFFGYSIALCGMVYYKLGYDAIKGYAGDAQRQWLEFGVRQPAMRKLAVAGGVAFVFILLLTAMAPANVVTAATNKLGQ
ncbi:uncharacterized protein MKZ38_004374 [Zalerion maritima]|uniref:Sugar phosphate transporter domain-containing protein n=1 Tax=Zalerion maritima TaxID=339359 RepID=A0AAD5RML3_9PEZI|nr:uncharacterized protein MKZ38_004374 [Zalerion maritima]